MKLINVLFAAEALATPLGFHEKRNTLDPKWAKRETLDADARMPVRVALKQQNLDKGMNYLMEVSDPSSAKYGHHYTADQVVELFAPKDESVAAVKDWLVKSGVPAGSITSTKSRGWLDFTTTVGELQKLLKTQYHVYSRRDGSGRHITTDRYLLPKSVEPHIDFIHPAFAFSRGSDISTPVGMSTAAARITPNPKPPKPVPQYIVSMILASPDNTQYCASYVTPHCIKAFYNITDGKLSSSSNRMGIYELDDEYPDQSDLTAFFGLFAPEIPPTYGPKIDLIDFGSSKPNSSNAEGEAALDFDMAHPIIYPQTTELFQAKDNYENGSLGFFNQFLDAIDGAYCHTTSYGETGDDPVIDGETPNEQCGTFKPTNVISFSYGTSESEFPSGYLKRQCDEYMKLGLQGVTLVTASGDGGVAGGHGDDCLGKDQDIFNPQINPACPYMTTVGSTVLASGNRPGDAEQATTSFASGGGFSNVWGMPQYQQSAVSSYFANYDPGFPSYSTSDNKIPESGTGVFNRAGRAYPDMAAIGDNGVIVFQGQVSVTGGTSMSAPVAAAIFTRINEELIAQGKSPIGFANPALYANPTMFNDVTIGNMASNGYCNGKGFSAVPGWDPVSGLGTPNYPAMLDYFINLQ